MLVLESQVQILKAFLRVVWEGDKQCVHECVNQPPQTAPANTTHTLSQATFREYFLLNYSSIVVKPVYIKINNTFAILLEKVLSF